MRPNFVNPPVRPRQDREKEPFWWSMTVSECLKMIPAIDNRLAEYVHPRTVVDVAHALLDREHLVEQIKTTLENAVKASESARQELIDAIALMFNPKMSAGDFQYLMMKFFPNLTHEELKGMDLEYQSDDFIMLNLKNFPKEIREKMSDKEFRERAEKMHKEMWESDEATNLGFDPPIRPDSTRNIAKVRAAFKEATRLDSEKSKAGKVDEIKIHSSEFAQRAAHVPLSIHSSIASPAQRIRDVDQHFPGRIGAYMDFPLAIRSYGVDGLNDLGYGLGYRGPGAPTSFVYYYTEEEIDFDDEADHADDVPFNTPSVLISSKKKVSLSPSPPQSSEQYTATSRTVRSNK